MEILSVCGARGARGGEGVWASTHHRQQGRSLQALAGVPRLSWRCCRCGARAAGVSHPPIHGWPHLSPDADPRAAPRHGPRRRPGAAGQRPAGPVWCVWLGGWVASHCWGKPLLGCLGWGGGRVRPGPAAVPGPQGICSVIPSCLLPHTRSLAHTHSPLHPPLCHPPSPGAELGNVLNEAALEAVRRDARQISQRDVYNAVDRVVQVGAWLQAGGAGRGGAAGWMEAGAFWGVRTLGGQRRHSAASCLLAPTHPPTRRSACPPARTCRASGAPPCPPPSPSSATWRFMRWAWLVGWAGVWWIDGGAGCLSPHQGVGRSQPLAARGRQRA